MALRLLPGERLEVRLRPHPIGFGGRYFLAFWPALWGLALLFIFRSEWWNGAESGKWYQVWTFLYGNTASAYVFAIAGLVLIGVLASLVMIRWSMAFLFLLVGGAVVGLTVASESSAETGLPLFAMVAAVPLVLGVELQRRSHKYTLTNLRILFQGGIFVRHERQLKYEAITDLDTTQGFLASLFDVGTLIPVTQSGFGLGTDTAQAQVMVGGGASKAGAMAGAGVAVGGGREVQTGRARSYHQLTGVRPYGDTKYLLETLIQAATATPYLQEQVALQRKMVERLEALSEIPMVEGKELPRK